MKTYTIINNAIIHNMRHVSKITGANVKIIMYNSFIDTIIIHARESIEIVHRGNVTCNNLYVICEHANGMQTYAASPYANFQHFTALRTIFMRGVLMSHINGCEYVSIKVANHQIIKYLSLENVQAAHIEVPMILRYHEKKCNNINLSNSECINKTVYA